MRISECPSGRSRHAERSNPPGAHGPRDRDQDIVRRYGTLGLSRMGHQRIISLSDLEKDSEPAVGREPSSRTPPLVSMPSLDQINAARAGDLIAMGDVLDGLMP